MVEKKKPAKPKQDKVKVMDKMIVAGKYPNHKAPLGFPDQIKDEDKKSG